ncbi:MAG: hypothetical protein V2A66_04010 [Pseudomonadota bacterium]
MNAIAGTLGFAPVMPYRLSGMRWLLFLAAFTTFAVAAPYLCHQFGLAGQVILPMHFAVIFAAMVMGLRGGVLTALASPLVSFSLSGMPPVGALLPMMAELAVYAAVAGWLVHHRHARIITALVCAMLAGRAVSLVFFAAGFGSAPSSQVLIRNLFLVGLPGIAAQLLLLPVMVSKIGDYLSRADV